MITSKLSYIFAGVTFLLVITNTTVFALNQAQEEPGFDLVSPHATPQEKPRINSISIEGNKAVTSRAILEKIPFHAGDLFDRKKTTTIIQGIYRLGYFRNIQVVTDEIAPGVINLIIVVTEKNRISGISFTGNSAVATDKIKTALNSSHIKTLDEEELSNIENQIKKLYREKGYHHATVTGSLQPDDKGTFTATFDIKEDIKSGIADRFLRTKIFTREDWILGFLDQSGTYHPDAIARDKYMIEDMYQSNGYLTARVVDTVIKENEYGEIEVTFVINEGELYCVSSVSIPGNEVLSEEQLIWRIPIRPGQLYSKDLIRKTMEQLRMLWGEFGYIYADVQPDIRPDPATKTVSVAFSTDLGNKIAVNRISIVGNKKTRENVIRREILFDEGDTLTTWLMDESKRRVEMLGFFDQKEGVNWKIIKIDEDTADLDLVLNEIKTGRMQMKMGFGPGGQGDAQSTTKNFSVNLEVFDTNFRGNGILYNMSGSWSQQDKVFNLGLGNRWLFDRPLYGGVDFHMRSTTYEDFNLTTQPPTEHTIGGGVNIGLRLEKLWYTQLGLAGGYESIRYSPEINVAKQAIYQPIVNRSFQAGDLAWLGGSLSQDARNHPLYPTQGYAWNADTKIGIPNPHSPFGFAKLEFEADWFTPLIQQYGLALHLNGYLGVVHILDRYAAPYRELFHIGGPGTVRGFTYGQIGPSIALPGTSPSSLGAEKAFTFSAELQFPITEDYNMRGVIFYDGGAGWDTPNRNEIPVGALRNEHFDFRHAIGFGIRLTSPTPICLDWGFKLDPRKRRGESLSEVHMSASQSF
jgi:outer membrane protein insertion porin family